MLLHRILVPLDDSELSEAALPYTKDLAARLGLDITLLHVCTPEERKSEPVFRTYIEHKAEVIKHQTQEAQEKIGIKPKELAFQAQGEIVIGSPTEEILRYADKKDIDLILMSAHSRSETGLWALGSVADKVLKVSKTPVWVIKTGVRIKKTPLDKWLKRTIVVPLDGSERAECILPYVEALAKQHGVEMEVVLFGVSEFVALPQGHMLSSESERAEVGRNKQLVEEYLDRIEGRLKKAGLNVRSEVRIGNAASEIINYVEANPPYLTVMCTHGRSGLSRWVFGSVAQKILRQAPTSVLMKRAHQHR